MWWLEADVKLVDLALLHTSFPWGKIPGELVIIKYRLQDPTSDLE